VNLKTLQTLVRGRNISEKWIFQQREENIFEYGLSDKGYILFAHTFGVAVYHIQSDLT